MYREAVITFIDILGFKQIIEKSSAEKVLNDLNKVRAFSGVNESGDGEGFCPKVIQFSDSVIRIRPLNSIENEQYQYGVLFQELTDLVFMQGGLAVNGILVRGGVTVGEIYFDDDQIYGQGFVKAYELESNFAIYPRIIVDPALISMAKKDSRLLSLHNSFNSEMDFINSQLRMGTDGFYYVDYLGELPDASYEQERAPEYFERVKETILSGIGNANCLTKISAKYMWLANYYNESVNENFGSEPEITKNLLITDKDLPFLSRLI